MSIELTKMVGSFRVVPPQEIAIDAPKIHQQNFNQVLDGAVNPLKPHDNLHKQVIEQMQLAHLRMLQGLFSVEDDNDDNDFFSGLNSHHRSPQLSLQQSQIVDKYYAPQQPTLMKPVSPGSDKFSLLINQVAEKISLAPELIHSVVSAESDYNPAAVSPVGAQGLMQLMPKTAQELGVQDSFDPLQNLLGGSKYLKQLLEKYDGDLDSALAAYNWGQGNVDRKGLEQMPEETRSYLARVKKNLAAAA